MRQCFLLEIYIVHNDESLGYAVGFYEEGSKFVGEYVCHNRAEEVSVGYVAARICPLNENDVMSESAKTHFKDYLVELIENVVVIKQ